MGYHCKRCDKALESPHRHYCAACKRLPVCPVCNALVSETSGERLLSPVRAVRKRRFCAACDKAISRFFHVFASLGGHHPCPPELLDARIARYSPASAAGEPIPYGAQS